MLFDRWQHCRQMDHRAQNIYNLSSMIETNNESFITEMYTLISNTAYLASIIRENPTMMMSGIEFTNTALISHSIQIMCGLEKIFGLLKVIALRSLENDHFLFIEFLVSLRIDNYSLFNSRGLFQTKLSSHLHGFIQSFFPTNTNNDCTQCE